MKKNRKETIQYIDNLIKKQKHIGYHCDQKDTISCYMVVVNILRELIKEI